MLTKIAKDTFASLPVGEPTLLADESLPMLNSPWILQLHSWDVSWQETVKSQELSMDGSYRKGILSSEANVV